MQNISEVKITIAKLLEVAYSKNKGVTTKLVKKKGILKSLLIVREMPLFPEAWA